MTSYRTHAANTVDKGLSNPWYKEFWAWFIFTPLVAIMGVMSVLIYFAYSAKDDVVTDNYQKKGRMLEASFDAQNFAKELGLVGLLTSINNTTYLILGAQQAVFAPSVLMYIEHPFKQELDTTVTLTLLSDNQSKQTLFDSSLGLLKQQTQYKQHYIYRLQSDKPLTGKRYLRASYLTPSPSTPSSLTQEATNELEVWRISGETHFDQSSYTFLTP